MRTIYCVCVCVCIYVCIYSIYCMCIDVCIYVCYMGIVVSISYNLLYFINRLLIYLIADLVLVYYIRFSLRPPAYYLYSCAAKLRGCRRLHGPRTRDTQARGGVAGMRKAVVLHIYYNVIIRTVVSVHSSY